MIMHPWIMAFSRSRNLKSKASSRYVASRGGNVFAGVGDMDTANRPSTSAGERLWTAGAGAEKWEREVRTDKHSLIVRYLRTYGHERALNEAILNHSTHLFYTTRYARRRGTGGKGPRRRGRKVPRPLQRRWPQALLSMNPLQSPRPPRIRLL